MAEGATWRGRAEKEEEEWKWDLGRKESEEWMGIGAEELAETEAPEMERKAVSEAGASREEERR